MSDETVAAAIITRIFGAPNLGIAFNKQIDLQNEIMKALRAEREACARVADDRGQSQVSADIRQRG